MCSKFLCKYFFSVKSRCAVVASDKWSGDEGSCCPELSLASQRCEEYKVFVQVSTYTQQFSQDKAHRKRPFI